MATVREVVLEHQQKQDGTWNVKIRVTHNRKIAYIPTEHYVVKKQLKKDFTLKDEDLIDLIRPVLKKYRDKISTLGEEASFLTAKELADRISRREDKAPVDFKGFCGTYIAQLEKAGRSGTARNLRSVYNALLDYFGHNKEISALAINSKMLQDFGRFLSSPREITMKTQTGGTRVQQTQGVGASGLFNYMRDLRNLFNAAKEAYNDEDRGLYRIQHNPFKQYKMPVREETKKRSIAVSDLIKIRDFEAPAGGRVEKARDLFMLSFYLCGMNAVDLYGIDKYTGGRVDYKRSKTKGKRADSALISIAVPDIAAPLAEKYLGKVGKMYASARVLNSVLSFGLQALRASLEIPGLDFYTARHTFATLARNECRFSKDDVAMALNHIDPSRRVTDIYIKPDWRIVDEVQAGVIALLDKTD